MRMVGEIVYKRYVDGDTMDEELAGHCEVVWVCRKNWQSVKRAWLQNGKKCMPCLWNLQSERCRILHVLRYGTSGGRGRKRRGMVYPGTGRGDGRPGRERRERRQKSRKQKLKKKPKNPRKK